MKIGSESPKRRGPFRTMWRAWRVRDNEELPAEDAASTLFRFFRSKHVADLKLVANLALILLVFHILLVVTSSVVTDDPPLKYIRNSLRIWHALDGSSRVSFHRWSRMSVRPLRFTAPSSRGPIFPPLSGLALSICSPARSRRCVASVRSSTSANATSRCTKANSILWRIMRRPTISRQQVANNP